MSFKTKTLWLIAIASVTRGIIAYSIDLGNDEVYYRMYAQYLQWNYFDHPPMVAWLIRATTANLQLDNNFFIRLGAIISSAITTWLFFLSGKKISNAYTGFLAALIYTGTIYGSIISGTFILPDSPQMICWSAGILILLFITDNSPINARKKLQMVWFGIITGVGMICKIHIAFLWLGFLMYVSCYNRTWLQKPVLYLSAIITLLFFYPVLHWNIVNHFVTYQYHSKRINMVTGGLNLTTFFTFFAGQLFYYNPILFPFIIFATVASIKNQLLISSSYKRILLLCSLPLIIVATIISFFKQVLPHWTGPAYCGLILITACYFSNKQYTAGKFGLIPYKLKASLYLLMVISFSGIITIKYYPGTIGKKQGMELGEGDFTLDMFGWKDLARQFQFIVMSNERSGVVKPFAVMVSNKWFPAAHIDYYIATPIKKDLILIGDTSDIHQYAWINKERKPLEKDQDAFCIVPSDNYFNVWEYYAPYFNKMEFLQTIVQHRNGVICRNFYIYLLKGFKGNNKGVLK